MRVADGPGEGAMEWSSQLWSAVVAAGTSLAIFGGQWVVRRREQRRQTQIQYLYPLKLACDELFDRWCDLARKVEREGDRVGRAFLEARERCADPRFYHECNDVLCNAVGTLHATACYFAHANRLREQLPLVRLRQKQALGLLEGIEAVRSALADGDPGAFWAEIQDSIGRLVTTEAGAVLPYATFCRALARDPDSYFRLFNFYVDIHLKYAHQLRWGYDALGALCARLDRILRVHPHETPGGAWSPAKPAAPRTSLPSRPRPRSAPERWLQRSRWTLQRLAARAGRTAAAPPGLHPGA
jgi:hypothetical protein